MNQELFLLSLEVSRTTDGGDGHNRDDDLGGNSVVQDKQNTMETDPDHQPPPNLPPSTAAYGSGKDLPGAKTAKLIRCNSWCGSPSEGVLALSPTKSMPGKLDANCLDDGVWDWEGHYVLPTHIDVDVDVVEEFSLS
jgi:hypothetical protein